jgi:hypothetical protein
VGHRSISCERNFVRLPFTPPPLGRLLGPSTRLEASQREVARRREVLGGDGRAALAVSARLGCVGGRSRGGGRSLAAAARLP